MGRIRGASKVTAKFQVTVPEAVRKVLRIKIGDTIAFVEEDGRIYISIEV